MYCGVCGAVSAVWYSVVCVVSLGPHGVSVFVCVRCGICATVVVSVCVWNPCVWCGIRMCVSVSCPHILRTLLRVCCLSQETKGPGPVP